MALFAVSLILCMPICSTAASYDEHTQTDGSWYVSDSQGGAVSSVFIYGSGSGDSSFLAGTDIKVIGSNWFDPNIYSDFYIGEGVYSGMSSAFYKIHVSIPEYFQGKVFTFSAQVKVIDGAQTNFRSAIYYTDGTRVDGTIVNGSDYQETKVTSNSSKTVSYIGFHFTYSNRVYVKDILLNLGDKPIGYEPYTLTSTILVPANLLFGDQLDVLSGTVTRSDGSVEFYDPQSVVLPVGVVNVLTSGRLGGISIKYNYDASGGSGGSDIGTDIQGNTFTRIMAKILDIFKIDFTLYGFTFSFWDIFVYSLLLGIVVYFVRDLIFG